MRSEASTSKQNSASEATTSPRGEHNERSEFVMRAQRALQNKGRECSEHHPLRSSVFDLNGIVHKT
jgi:hypothetical protein